MPTLPPLLVPMEIKALVVNDQVRIGQNFQRWSMNYNQLTNFTSPEPLPFSGNANDFSGNPKNNGVYLHWTLPYVLRQGQHVAITGSVDFPLVPNRWLVIRVNSPLNARRATGWVVQSDFLDPNKATSPYLDPFAATNRSTAIGTRIEITPQASWQEPGGTMFLKAVGPANVTFAAYQPANENVFSIHDTLDGVPDQDTLSYLVVGWFSDPSKDILADWGADGSFSGRLAALNWSVQGGSGQTARTSVYHGLVTRVQWDKSGPIPPSMRPADPRKSVCVSVGNTSIDALTALIKNQAEAAGKGAGINPELLEAFQYDLLPYLDQPDGERLVEQKIHQAWYGAHPGGYFWETADKPLDQPGQQSDRRQTLTLEELAGEARWLAALNQAQTEYDDAVLKLRSLQWQLYALWWKQGKASSLPQYPDAISAAQFQQELDPQSRSGLLYQVYQQIQQVGQLQQSIPWGETPDALQDAISAHAKAHGLADTRVLKRLAKPSFWSANNPVVLISGTKSSGLLVDDNPLPCRFPDQLVKGFSFNAQSVTVASMQGTIPSVNLTNLPDVAAGLLNEFFFLDPCNGAMVAQSALGSSSPSVIQQVGQVMEARQTVTGILPAVSLAPWQQPWTPLLLMWEVVYYPIVHDVGGQPTWTFDGTQYTWTGNGVGTNGPITFSGRVFLTPHSSFNFKARLDKYMQQNPDADMKVIEDFITQTDGWDFLSQSLDGLSQQAVMRDPLGNLAPNDPGILFPPRTTLASLVGSAGTYVPMPGVAKKIPFKGWPPSNFQQWRSGQFYFNRLMVVDRFGQSIEVVNSTTSAQFRPVVAEGLAPDKTVIPGEPYRFIQLSPRLLQAGRLNFDFVSATDDNKVINLDADANPICAWVIPNHLDEGLSFYDNMGGAIGGIRVVTTDRQAEVLHWDPAPESPCKTLEDVAVTFPHLGRLLQSLAAKGPQAYGNLLQAIDETLWTVDPLGARDDQYLSVLIGRPLALVRARLQFELEVDQLTDQSWRYTFSPQQPDYPNYLFPIRLGDVKLWKDGLLGYFAGNSYDRFNVVHYPEDITQADPPYLTPIGPDNFPSLSFSAGSRAYFTMLMDPRASIHATTAILPVTEIGLPHKFVDGALRNMKVTFRIGPLLSDVQVAAVPSNNGDDAPVTIIMPQPAGKSGKWSFWEHDSQKWNQYGIAAVDGKVRFNNILSRLRTGLLALSDAVEEKTSA